MASTNSGLSGKVSAIPFVPNSSSIASIREFNPSSTSKPDINLPDGDDILGISSNTQPQKTQNISAQAARMFDSIRLDQPPPPTGGPSTNTMAPMQFAPPHLMGGRSFNTSAPLFHRGSTPSAGRGFASNAMTNIIQPSNNMPASHAPTKHPSSSTNATHPSTGRGRGRGSRGGRGRGPPVGPGSNRPSVAAHFLDPGRMQLAGRFVSETLRRDMEHRRFIAIAQPDEETLRAAGLPAVVHQYDTLCPLEDSDMAAERPSASLGVCSFIFKGVHTGDGAAYAVRRVDGRHIVPTADLLESAEETVARWSQVANHPNIVGLREVFVSDEVDATPSLFFSYDFHAGAYTVEQLHLAGGTLPISEDQLWSYTVQLTSALRAIHSAGLVLGQAALMPSKVIVSSPSRVRLAAVGLSQALMLEGTPTPSSPDVFTRGHREDLTSLGQLLLLLACSGRNAVAPSLDILAQHYSRELCRTIAGLLASREGSGYPNYQAVVSSLAERSFAELQSADTACDTLSNELEKECDNGRIARLLIKLCMINERPDLLGDASWSDTADRYLLKLFRDFVFHQVDERGKPVMEWGAVIEALNKMDAGVGEKIMLLSRDETSMLVVSYADVKRCLLNAYGELKIASEEDKGGRQGGRNG